MPASRPYQYCAICTKAHNSLNGRYCGILKRYVEYSKEPPCNK